ncbi:hypothetical protein Ddc_00290 [Ditylenchus destructor]|nr:hypothetical protein Ddc_00290 [Ditylenchus destructor]
MLSILSGESTIFQSQHTPTPNHPSTKAARCKRQGGCRIQQQPDPPIKVFQCGMQSFRPLRGLKLVFRGSGETGPRKRLAPKLKTRSVTFPSQKLCCRSVVVCSSDAAVVYPGCCSFAADSSLSQSIALLDDLCEDIPASEVAGPTVNTTFVGQDHALLLLMLGAFGPLLGRAIDCWLIPFRCERDHRE